MQVDHLMSLNSSGLLVYQQKSPRWVQIKLESHQLVYTVYINTCAYIHLCSCICVFYGGNDSGSGTMSQEPLYSMQCGLCNTMQVVLFAEWMK